MYCKLTLNLYDKIDYIDSLNSQFRIEDITGSTQYCKSL